MLNINAVNSLIISSESLFYIRNEFEDLVSNISQYYISNTDKENKNEREELINHKINELIESINNKVNI